MTPNDGLIILRPLDFTVPTMVSGPGRSGTTLMIRCLQALGVNCFYDEQSPNAEEYEFVRNFTGSSDPARLEWVRDRIAERRTYLPWATKVPGGAVQACNFPVLGEMWPGNWIVLGRDYVATANRDLSLRPGIDAGYQLCYRATELATSMIAAVTLAHQRGVVCVSYEKLLMKPEAVLGPIVGMLRLDVGRIPAALAEIRAEDPRYLGPKGPSTPEVCDSTETEDGLPQTHELRPEGAGNGDSTAEPAPAPEAAAGQGANAEPSAGANSELPGSAAGAEPAQPAENA